MKWWCGEALSGGGSAHPASAGLPTFGRVRSPSLPPACGRGAQPEVGGPPEGASLVGGRWLIKH
jgi:hypothetical protein